MVRSIRYGEQDAPAIMPCVCAGVMVNQSASLVGELEGIKIKEAIIKDGELEMDNNAQRRPQTTDATFRAGGSYLNIS